MTIKRSLGKFLAGWKNGKFTKGANYGVITESSYRRVGRNTPCPCGSGKKYKKCCLPRHRVEAQRNQDKGESKTLSDRYFAVQEYIKHVE